MSQADREKWEARYAKKNQASEPVDPFLEEVADRLPSSGRALDVAGGSGRNALFLARRGLESTLVDISERGLELARSAAAAEGLAISTRATDLDRDSLPSGLFDVVTCTWFLLGATHWKAISRVLVPGGLVIYVQPTTAHSERHAHPGHRFLVDFDELAVAVRDAGIEFLRFEQGWDAKGSHTARLLGRRTPDET